MRKQQGKFLKITLLFLCMGWHGVAAQRQASSKHPHVSDTPVSEPTIFAQGVVSTGDFDSHPAFTPDGKTLYFVRSTPTFNFWTILVSRFENGQWQQPEIAPFSGQYSDADPFITSDGSHFYFISNRPVAGKATQDLDIWVMEKNGDGWGEPKNLGEPVNSPGNEWYPTIASNGSIYFGSDRQGGKGRTDIYRCRVAAGTYSQAENLGDLINTSANEFEALISPEEKFLILMAGGRADGLGGFDLYISYNRDGSWTKPVNLGSKINSAGNEYSPTISPDKKYFFWTSARGFADTPLKKRLNSQELMIKLRSPGNGLGDIYYIDIAALAIGNKDK